MLITEDTFIISDTHFGDHKPITEEYVINAWNKTVSENDTVLHLGDFVSDGPVEVYNEPIN